MDNTKNLSEEEKFQFLAKTCDYLWVSSKLTQKVLNTHILDYLCRTKAKDIKIIFTEKFKDWDGDDVDEESDSMDLVDWEDTDDEKQEEVQILRPNLSEDDVMDCLAEIFDDLIMNVTLGELLQGGNVEENIAEYQTSQDFLVFNMEDSSYWSFRNISLLYNFCFEKFSLF